MQAVSEHQTSDMYRNAVVAQKYYARENVEILKRLSALQRTTSPDLNVIYHKLCNGFFPFFVKQLSQYLLGNGVTLTPGIKTRLGPKFDKSLQKAGVQALVDGVNWGFWNQPTERIPYEHLLVFRVTEFVPLFDEITGDLRAGIRFTQIDKQKPVVYYLFTETEIINYKSNDSGIEEIGRQPYKRKVRRDGLGEEVVDTENYPTIPIFPLYANELKKSEFIGLKATIDAYDFINSDLADGITQVEGVYWIIKNFGGDDERELVQTLQRWKALVDDGDANAEARPESLEIPYQAKQAALELLRKQLFSDFMALDLEAIQGGSLTNVAINVAKTNFDLKTDFFEWQCAEFVENILSLIGITEEPKFKRRSITNDTETVSNIHTMKEDGYIDEQWAIENNPLIADVDQDDLIDRLKYPGEVGALTALTSAQAISSAELRAAAKKELKSLSRITDEEITAAQQGLPGAFDEGDAGM